MTENELYDLSGLGIGLGKFRIDHGHGQKILVVHVYLLGTIHNLDYSRDKLIFNLTKEKVYASKFDFYRYSGVLLQFPLQSVTRSKDIVNFIISRLLMN